MEDFIALVLIVFGILQIILFFKIWGMTNNVKEMRDYFLSGKDAMEMEDEESKAEEESRKKEREKYLVCIGDIIVHEGIRYEVVEHLSQEMCKCRDVKTGDLYSLKLSELKGDRTKMKNFLAQFPNTNIGGIKM